MDYPYLFRCSHLRHRALPCAKICRPLGAFNPSPPRRSEIPPALRYPGKYHASSTLHAEILFLIRNHSKKTTQFPTLVKASASIYTVHSVRCQKRLSLAAKPPGDSPSQREAFGAESIRHGGHMRRTFPERVRCFEVEKEWAKIRRQRPGTYLNRAKKGVAVNATPLKFSERFSVLQPLPNLPERSKAKA